MLMSSYGAHVFIMNIFLLLINKEDIGLYRDDRLGVLRNLSPSNGKY